MQEAGVIIRDAVEGDLPAILEIYNHAIATSTAVYYFDPVDLAERCRWFEARLAAGYPVLVAEVEGMVAGFGSFGDWRVPTGYAWTVEHSVYVEQAFRGRGIGSAMLRALIERARAIGKHVMIGGVDADNVASLALHEKLGFRRAGHFQEVGRKFERWLDLVFVELRL